MRNILFNLSFLFCIAPSFGQDFAKVEFKVTQGFCRYDTASIRVYCDDVAAPLSLHELKLMCAGGNCSSPYVRDPGESVMIISAPYAKEHQFIFKMNNPKRHRRVRVTYVVPIP